MVAGGMLITCGKLWQVRVCRHRFIFGDRHALDSSNETYATGHVAMR